MLMLPIPAAALLVAVALSTLAQAQAVFRCGNAYSQHPCEHGRAVEVADTRGPAQEAEARRVASSERQLAATLRRDRLALERAAVSAGAVSLGGVAVEPTNAPSAASTHKRKLTAARLKPAVRDFVALDPASRRRSTRN